jgi:hypothetical protein
MIMVIVRHCVPILLRKAVYRMAPLRTTELQLGRHSERKWTLDLDKEVVL